MNSSDHVEPEVLDRFARGDLAEGELSAVLHHLENCATCSSAGPRRAHEDLAALRSELTTGDDRSHLGWILGIAAAVAAALIGVLLLRSPATPNVPPVQPQIIETRPIVPIDVPKKYGRAEWDALVRDARAGTSLKLPEVLKQLRRAPGELRSPNEGSSGSLAPSGVVIESTRPRFEWKAPNVSSTVTIFSGDREIARSTPTTAGRWTPSRDLPRGLTYTWEVQFEKNGELQILPAPPAPPARFHVLDATTYTELEAARREHPSDPLFLGLLYARAGLVDAAIAELRRVSDPADTVVARRVISQLESK